MARRGLDLVAQGATYAQAAEAQLPPARPGRYYTWAELTVSAAAKRLGRDNTPPPEARRAMALLVARVLDPLRAGLGRPVRVTSGYRSPAVNQAVHGSPTSQHILGEAADIEVPGMRAEEVATAIVRLGLPVDQVIWYAPERGGHVHVSHTDARPNRGQTLHAPASGGYVAWAPAEPPRSDSDTA